MLPNRYYIELDDANRKHLDNVISLRWRKHRRNVIISSILPFILIPFPAAFLFMFGLITIINIALTNNRFRALYIDKRNNKKLRIPFHPIPYCIPELQRYYIQTNIIQYPHIPVDKETYYWMNTDQVLFMDLAPKSGILFEIKTEDDVYPVINMPGDRTPDQVITRLR